MREDELKLLLSANAIGEDDDLSVTKGVAHGWDGIEVTLRPGCNRLLVELWVLGLEVCLAASHGDLGRTRKLSGEVTDQHLHSTSSQGSYRFAVEAHDPVDCVPCGEEGLTV